MEKGRKNCGGTAAAACGLSADCAIWALSDIFFVILTRWKSIN